MAKNSNTYKTFNIHENTPKALYNQLDEEFHFTFDPCPPNPSFDGLNVDWKGNIYINPPYGKAIRFWLEKALKERESGNCEVAVFLLPAYTDVKWFHEIVLPKAKEIRFIKGKLRFGEHKESAPFASMVVIL
jgi:hypothetical protein